MTITDPVGINLRVSHPVKPFPKPGLAFCPIHEYERYECGPQCRARRKAFKKIAHEFNVLWHDRMRRGVSYVSLKKMSRCQVCSNLFKPERSNQLYCTVECRRREQWLRRYSRLKGAA